MNVPFVDLKMQYEGIKEEINTAIGEVLSSCAFVLGPAVERFEQQFAQYLGVKHCVAVNSGTSAILVSLMIRGIGPGDEVITVPNSFIATVEPVVLLGATPVFVDVDGATRNIDVSKIETALSPKTRAIMPVHLYGQPADMDPILEIAERHKLSVIEDAAQSHGATYKEKKAGSIGTMACFSFYPGKNLGAYGEGGMIATDDEEIATKARQIRDHGSFKKYHHVMLGINARMAGIQGAVLGVKMQYLEQWTESRRSHARIYNQLLNEVDVVIPFEADYARHVYHLYVIQTKKRNQLRECLQENNIASGIHYPIPLHLEESLAFLGYKKGDFPVTERLSEQILSLPMYPELNKEQVEFVVKTIATSLS